MVSTGTILWHSIQVMVLGMVVVFIGLAFLVFAVHVMNYLMDRKKTDAVEQSAIPAASVVQAVGLPVVAAAPVLEAEADGELATIAALTAITVAAADTGKRFVVRAIRRVDGSAWASR